MISLRHLPNSQLLDSVSRLAVEERKNTLAILSHFREIERRKAYSDLGYRSLFEYAVGHLKYSEGSASRRISAMHAMKEMPELEEKIAKGETTVTNVARIHTVVRRDEKLSKKKWEPKQKSELFSSMVSLSTRELDRQLAEIAPEAASRDFIRSVAPQLHEIRITVDEETLKALESLQAALAASLRNPGSKSELISRLIRLAHERGFKSNRSAYKRARSSSENASSDGSGLNERGSGLNEQNIQKGEHLPNRKSEETVQRNASPAPGKFKRRKISRIVSRQVRERAHGKCEQILPNGSRCNATFRTEVDHLREWALGGSEVLENLQLLCRDHNQIRGIRTFGPSLMQRN